MEAELIAPTRPLGAETDSKVSVSVNCRNFQCQQLLKAFEILEGRGLNEIRDSELMNSDKIGKNS
jgi:hypothetical protein